MTKPKKVVQGGTSAGKTYGIMAVAIDWATRNPNKKMTVVAETIPAVKDGASDIFKNIMMYTGRWVEERWLKNPFQYTFANGTEIQFKSFETVGKAAASGKRDWLFLNEANNIPFNIADALMIRSLQTWVDYNPTERFWAHDEVLTEDSAEFLLLKYTDNEALPEPIRQQIMERERKRHTSKYWENWCRVYIDGEIGNLEGIVFDNWEITDNYMPGNMIGYGLDFGYVHSPTALVQLNEHQGDLYADEHVYRTNMSNDDIYQVASEKCDLSEQAIADSAEPKSIDFLFKKGWKGIKPAIKGEDSVRSGIDKLLQRKIYVTKRSVNLIKELRSYMWDTDKDGRKLNKPIKDNDHAIDAMRYLYSYPKKKTLAFA